MLGSGKKTALLIIDPQRDFHAGGSLAVPGAEEDMQRLCSFIRQRLNSIDDIFVTLDNHQPLHIAHGLFWRRGPTAAADQPMHPPEFSVITENDVRHGIWETRQPEHRAWGLSYCHNLERLQHFQLQIWPRHCIVGSLGHAVVQDLNDTLQEWIERRLKSINWVYIGGNALTEHYSAFRAEVPVPSDPSTQMNVKLLNQLLEYNRVFVAGQALSHCVNFTIRDMVRHWPDERRSEVALLQDCCSSVPGSEHIGRSFLLDMRASGIVLCKSTDAPT